MRTTAMGFGRLDFGYDYSDTEHVNPLTPTAPPCDNHTGNPWTFDSLQRDAIEDTPDGDCCFQSPVGGFISPVSTSLHRCNNHEEARKRSKSQQSTSCDQVFHDAHRYTTETNLVSNQNRTCRRQGHLFVCVSCEKTTCYLLPLKEGLPCNSQGNSRVLDMRCTCMVKAKLLFQEYIFFLGMDSSGKECMVSYDVLNGKFKQKRMSPKLRQDYTAVAIDHKIYLLGGNNGNMGSFIKTIDVYNMKTNKWKECGELTIGVSNPVAEVFGGKIFIIGGQNENGHATNYIQMFDTESKEQHRTLRCSNLPVGCSGMRTFVSEKCLGIVCDDGNVVTYDPRTDRCSLSSHTHPGVDMVLESFADDSGAIHIVGTKFRKDSNTLYVKKLCKETGMWDEIQHQVLATDQRVVGGVVTLAVCDCFMPISNREKRSNSI